MIKISLILTIKYEKNSTINTSSSTINTSRLTMNNSSEIKDVESAFEALKINSPNIKKIIQILEKGTYIEGDTYKDQFDRYLDLHHLSTGTKAVLLLDHFSNIKSDIEIHFTEVGYTHYNYAISNYTFGKIRYPRYKKINNFEFLDVELNGIKVNNSVEFNTIIERNL